MSNSSLFSKGKGRSEVGEGKAKEENEKRGREIRSSLSAITPSKL